MNSSVFENPNIWYVWSWCLLKANHEPHKFPFNGEDIEILPGEFITGRTEALKELHHISAQKYRNCITYLKSTSRITSKTTNKFSLIKITNWDSYQANNQQNNQQTTSQQPASNHIQECKECKECKNEYSLGLGIEYWNARQAWNPANGNPINNTAIKKLLPQCRKETTSLAKMWDKQVPSQEEWERAVRAYILEIANRNPLNDYCHHRFSMFDFITQKNGYLKFVNK